MNYVNVPNDSFKLLQNLIKKYPSHKEILDEIDSNLNQRLWHQLSDNINKFASNEDIQKSSDLIELYNGLILFVESTLNPMKFLHFVQLLLSNYKGKMEEGLAFVENVENKMKFEGEEKLYVQILKGYCYLDLNKMYDLEDILNNIKIEFEKRSEIDPVIYIDFYRLSTYFYEKKEDYDEFYHNAFQYLAYQNQISDLEKLNLCFKMCVASLIGEKMFNFAELIEKDFFKLMQGTQYEWIYNLILSFNSSKVDQFLQMIKNYESQIKSNNILKDKIDFLGMKIRIAALLDLIFQKNKNERTILFKEIMQNCLVDSKEIEFIVMKALSLNLIKGHIDQVEEKVVVNWIQPKYLDKDKINILKGRFENWIVKANRVLKEMEDFGGDLFKK